MSAGVTASGCWCSWGKGQTYSAFALQAYQNHALEDSDFVSSEPEGTEILYTDRRFVLGRGLRDNSSFKTWQPDQLGLTGTLQVQIPKSINRLRLKGSGSRFVHGGATLQEVVIPVTNSAI